MLDDLRAKFRTRFLETARQRLVRVRSPQADSGVMASELHSLAGEASILEYDDCAELAKSAERHARAGEARKCRDVIDALAKAVDAIDA